MRRGYRLQETKHHLNKVGLLANVTMRGNLRGPSNAHNSIVASYRGMQQLLAMRGNSSNIFDTGEISKVVGEWFMGVVVNELSKLSQKWAPPEQKVSVRSRRLSSADHDSSKGEMTEGEDGGEKGELPTQPRKCLLLTLHSSS